MLRAFVALAVVFAFGESPVPRDEPAPTPGPSRSEPAAIPTPGPEAKPEPMPQPLPEPPPLELDTLVEGIVALIDNQPLFWSEVEFETRLMLLARGKQGALRAPLSNEELAFGLEEVIARRLAAREAERLQIFAPSSKDVEAEVALIEERFPPGEPMERWLASRGASMEQLEKLLARALRAERYLESRARGPSRVTERDLAAWYRDHSGQYGDRPLEEVSDDVRQNLLEDRKIQARRKHLAELAERYSVRFLPPFARSGFAR